MNSEKQPDEAAEDFRLARTELTRLLADPLFRVSNRNRAFLHYAAEQQFAGNTKGVKAYVIAVDVFGRPPCFDPEADPIVRIEASRLRAALDQYYAAYGEAGQVRIDLPRGRYVTVFRRIQKANPSPVADIVDPANMATVDRHSAIDPAECDGLESDVDDDVDDEIYGAFADLKEALDKQNAILRALIGTLQETAHASASLNETMLKKQSNDYLKA